MKREIHKEVVRRKILLAARKLFKERGFQQTTIRQIVKEADVKIGTMYHFFKDKEDLFLNMVSGITDRIIEKADEMTADDDVYLRFAQEVRLHLEAILDDKRSAELYYITFTSERVAQEIMRKRQERLKNLLSTIDNTATDADYRVRTLLVKGYLLAVAIEAVHTRSLDKTTTILTAIDMLLTSFKAPKVDIQRILNILTGNMAVYA